MSFSYDVFLPGDYCFDLIYSGLGKFPEPGCEVYSEDIIATGGAMYITAVSLQRLGVRVGWSPCFGTDYYSQYVRELALREGIDLAQAKSVDAPCRRVTTAIPFQGERAFVSYMDPAPCDMIAYWTHMMQQCDFKHLHIGAVQALAQMMVLVDAAHARGATVSLDCQDVPDLHSACEWSRLLKRVDIFMPNAREARIVTGIDPLEQAIQRLCQWVKIVVIKDGGNGVWVGYQDTVFCVPAIDTGPVVDTTGAGDCFNAGFLCGYVLERAPLEVCARYGNICGSRSITAVGGATAAPDRAELQKWLASYTEKR